MGGDEILTRLRDCTRKKGLIIPLVKCFLHIKALRCSRRGRQHSRVLCIARERFFLFIFHYATWLNAARTQKAVQVNKQKTNYHRGKYCALMTLLDGTSEYGFSLMASVARFNELIRLFPRTFNDVLFSLVLCVSVSTRLVFARQADAAGFRTKSRPPE
jgi:hypothetical protein